MNRTWLYFFKKVSDADSPIRQIHEVLSQIHYEIGKKSSRNLLYEWNLLYGVKLVIWRLVKLWCLVVNCTCAFGNGNSVFNSFGDHYIINDISPGIFSQFITERNFCHSVLLRRHPLSQSDKPVTTDCFNLSSEVPGSNHPRADCFFP